MIYLFVVEHSIKFLPGIHSISTCHCPHTPLQPTSTFSVTSYLRPPTYVITIENDLVVRPTKSDVETVKNNVVHELLRLVNNSLITEVLCCVYVCGGEGGWVWVWL